VRSLMSVNKYGVRVHVSSTLAVRVFFRVEAQTS